VNGTLEVTETIDASLIGGYIIKMGDMQIDASISNQLNNLKQRLTH
jgi:F-type H+-transporting ATPase subunit delta